MENYYNRRNDVKVVMLIYHNSENIIEEIWKVADIEEICLEAVWNNKNKWRNTINDVK